MDEYLQHFIDYLQEKLNDRLAGVMIYGSYVEGYFDAEKSDYDIFVIFKDEVVDLKDEIAERFPKVSLQLYMNLHELDTKIIQEGWNTFIVTAYTGKVLYSTDEFNHLRNKFKNFLPNISDHTLEQKMQIAEKLRNSTEVINEREGYDLNKFFYHSLKRKLQIIYFLINNRIELEFNNLIKDLKLGLIQDNLEVLLSLENTVHSRKSELLADKDKYKEILVSADNELESLLIKN